MWAFNPLKGQENGSRWLMLRTSAASLPQSWAQNTFRLIVHSFLQSFHQLKNQVTTILVVYWTWNRLKITCMKQKKLYWMCRWSFVLNGCRSGQWNSLILKHLAKEHWSCCFTDSLNGCVFAGTWHSNLFFLLVQS